MRLANLTTHFPENLGGLVEPLYDLEDIWAVDK